MIKKRRRGSGRSPLRKRAPVPVTPETARKHLAEARFREAIAEFKELIKTGTHDPQWVAELAEAYAGRARQLESKGMQKEALVIWEHRATLGAVSVEPEQIRLLLQVRRNREAVTLVQACTDARIQARWRTHLAAHFLAGEREIVADLPPEDPILSQAEALRAAVEAYSQERDAEAADRLSGIPFRSPYRDMVQILKALLAFPTAPEEALPLLERIPEDSGFFALASVVRFALTTTEADSVARTSSSDGALVALLAALRGWSPERQRLARRLYTSGSPIGFRERLRLLQQAPAEAPWRRTYELRLYFAERQAGGRSSTTQIAALALTPLEGQLLRAWSWEQSKDPEAMATAWEKCADAAASTIPRGTPGERDATLSVALMLRRTAQKTAPFRHADSNTSRIIPPCVAQLEHSLRFDSADQETFLRLIRHYIRDKNLKMARARLKQAQDRWPQDKPVLIAGIETALASQAFKKAAGLARQVLAIDPINHQARVLLVDSYFDHARKNLRQGRPDLAAQVLRETHSWVNAPDQHERLERLAAFVLLAEEEITGIAVLGALAERLGNGLEARLAMAFEASGIYQSIPGLFRKLGFKALSDLKIPDLLAFFERLRRILDRGHALPADSRQVLQEPLRAAARLPLDKAQYEIACETLERAGFQESRHLFALAALRRWPHEPLFEWHAIMAKMAPRRWSSTLTEEEFNRLEDALERAREAGNARLTHRILEVLQRYRPFQDLFDEDDDEEEPDSEHYDRHQLLILENLVRRFSPEAFDRLIESENPISATLRKFEAMVEELPIGQPPNVARRSRRSGRRSRMDGSLSPRQERLLEWISYFLENLEDES